jgi:SAM-dependent methyltransferase
VGFHHLGGFLLGVEGAALLRAHALGSTREEFGVRLDEIAGIVAAVRSGELDIGWDALEGIATTGYAVWAAEYDGPNPLVDVEEPVVHGLLADLPVGVAVDVACGTGRHTRFLAEAGHSVLGVDESPEMLAVARKKLPADVQFAQGDVCRLPLADASVDVAVCALALTHLPELAQPMAELARVVRSGGSVVLSDIHWVSLFLGGVPHVTLPDGTIVRMPASRFTAADYVGAALAAGLVVEACHEPAWPDFEDGHGGPLIQQWCQGAARDAWVGTPAAVVWKLRRP